MSIIPNNFNTEKSTIEFSQFLKKQQIAKLMRKANFYQKLSTLSRELSWSNNCIIFSRAKTSEEREFYLKTAKKERYSARELERQIDSVRRKP